MSAWLFLHIQSAVKLYYNITYSVTITVQVNDVFVYALLQWFVDLISLWYCTKTHCPSIPSLCTITLNFQNMNNIIVFMVLASRLFIQKLAVLACCMQVYILQLHHEYVVTYGCMDN